jgi:F-box-like
MAILKVHRLKIKHTMGLRRNPPKEADVRTSLAQWHVPTVDWCDHNVARVAIDMLPDVALLNIFDLYLEEDYINPMVQIEKPPIEVWRTLAQVCRKWRNIVFESPRRLDLRVYCRPSTPVREMLDIWPNLPVVVWVHGHLEDVDNTIAALEHNDRVCAIYLWDVQNSGSEKILAAMKRPFPALTRLVLGSKGETGPLHPDSFLGRSAQRLQSLILERIPFPGLPTLLLSATHLVNLRLWGIPHSGYFSPDAMVTTLSVLTRLESLSIGFGFPRSRPAQKSRRSPPTPALLPVLTHLLFRGVSEYLEDLVARIDAPLLDRLNITFYHKLIFDTPQLALFISRTPKFKVFKKARVGSYRPSAKPGALISLQSTSGARYLVFQILSRHQDWQLLSLARLCGSSFPQALIPVERIYIETFEDRRHFLGKTRAANGSNFYIYLPGRRISTYPRNSRHALRPPCKSPSVKE